MTKPNPHARRFAKLFDGFGEAYGTGEGRWVKQSPTLGDYSMHLAGIGPGLGIAPLRRDGTVSFASIDLDRPDFDMGRDLMGLLPGPSFMERSRSGNVHVHIFFAEPIEGWIPRGILREACAALGDPQIEVFPKQDKLRPGGFPNYINLPYYGDTRPIMFTDWNPGEPMETRRTMELGGFVTRAEASLNDVYKWKRRADLLEIPSPAQREAMHTHEFGTQPHLHMCAEHIIENAATNPVIEGHRAVVFFNLACQLANCVQFNHDEALSILEEVNDASPDAIDPAELDHMLSNAERGGYTRTGCDDPLMSPYVHPDCPIARR